MSQNETGLEQPRPGTQAGPKERRVCSRSGEGRLRAWGRALLRLFGSRRLARADAPKAPPSGQVPQLPVKARQSGAGEEVQAREHATLGALRERERELATLMSNLPGMAYRCANDRNWTMKFVSAGARALTGYAAEDLLGNARVSYAEVIHPDDRERIWEEVQRAVAHDRPFVLDYRIRDASGTERWVWERGCGIKDAAGKVVALEGFITDITDRKRMEESVRRSEQHYRSTVSALIEGVIVFDSQGRALTCNPSAERILGLRLDQMQREKQSLADWTVFREDLSPFPNDQLPLARALATGQSQRGVTFGHRRPDGEIRWLLVNAEPIFDRPGERTGPVVVSFTDITERVRAETALRENEERLRLVLSTTNQGFYDLDIRSGEVVVSPEYARMLGFEPEEFHETETAWRQRLHPADRETASRAYEEYLAGRQQHYRVEFRLRTKSGQYRWILSVGKVVARDAAGRPLRMLGTHTDITDRKEAETRLAEQVRELQRWHDATLGREIRILELKRQVNELLEKAGQPPRYPSAELEAAKVPAADHPTGAPSCPA